ncbi:hypothetical protein [Streptomyces bambusae]|uniref:DUF4190 domain-containing protein n=1 Tax=Streptomyces bambusae TaxID=1550616 RepID=A0ABS6Z523_9ACTN|nr:hypothetical protein [Streptomyces bambusae]MBW5482656.1 hypothetical protein [Streptomyces bambusae]
METNESTGAGTAAVVLGGLGLMALALTPVLLPAFLAAPPLGIAAVICAAVARGRVRRGLASGARTANVGLGLGITAVAVPVALAAAAFWMLHEVYAEDSEAGRARPTEYSAPPRTPVVLSSAPQQERTEPGRVVYQDGVEVTVHAPQAFSPAPDSPTPLPAGRQAYRVLITVNNPGDQPVPLVAPVSHLYDRTGRPLSHYEDAYAAAWQKEHGYPVCPDEVLPGQRVECLHTVHVSQGTPWVELSVIPSSVGHDPAHLRLPLGT